MGIQDTRLPTTDTPARAADSHRLHVVLLKEFIRRLGLFFVVFWLIPFGGAMLAALRGSTRLGLIWEPLAAEPLFTLVSIAEPIVAALAVAASCSTASLLVWRVGERHVLPRVIRVFILFLTVSLLLNPAFAATVPFIRTVPFAVTIAALVAILMVLCWLPSIRSDVREPAVFGAMCALFFWNPVGELDSAEFKRLSGRELNPNDVVILGFDSVSYPDVAGVLREYKPKSARKIVFENATTPLASTNAAWRTIFSGAYPDASALPGDLWGRERQSWLPDELKARGYTITLLQDDPTTNVFRDDENIGVTTLQGWKWMVKTFMWRTLFPLSEVAGGLWMGALGGPAHFSSRYAYNAAGFQEYIIRKIGEAATTGTMLFAAHTCYVHTPLQLQLREVVRIDGWWRKAPTAFGGGVSFFTMQETTDYRQILENRTESMRRLLRRTLIRLDEVGVIGRATVFVLSDHGPRASWVSSRGAHHVVLTAFLPGSGSDVIETNAVSLVDVAPTVRNLLQISSQHSDGAVLPLAHDAKAINRTTRQITPLSVQAGAKALMDPRNMNFAGNVRYRRDGTFVLSDRLRSEIAHTIEQENRVLESLNYLIRHKSDPAEPEVASGSNDDGNR